MGIDIFTGAGISTFFAVPDLEKFVLYFSEPVSKECP